MGATQRKIEAGQYLFREGDPSNSLFIIKSGTISIRKVKGSDHVEIARIYANETIGELSFFDRQPRSAAAVAMTNSEVLEIDFQSLDKCYNSIPDYMRTIMASLAERLRKTDDLVRRLQSNPGESSKSGPIDDEDLASVLAATADQALESAPSPAAKKDPGKK